MKHPHNKRQSFTLKTSARAITLALAAPLASAALINPVFAQDGAIEEIIVTATRRAGTVQDVPINIAAVDGQRIEKQGFGEISDLLAFVPGINAVDQGGRNGNVVIVRGINAEPLGQGSGNDVGGTVATYVGEIPLPIDLRLKDLQRVEVLLGPQGTLYGAGTLSGAIRYIPNKPNAEEALFEVRGEVYDINEGSGLSTDFGLTFNQPLSDTLSVRGSIDKSDDKGFIDYPFVVRTPGFSEPDTDRNDAAASAANFNPSEDANGQEMTAGRIALRWQPSDTFDATLTYFFQDEDNAGRSVSGARGGFATSRFASPSRVLEPNEEENRLLALEITADLGFAELTSATGIASYEEAGQRDQTDLLISLEYSYETFPTFTAFTLEQQEQDFFNQEIRLVSTSDSNLNWIVGAFYNKAESVDSSSEFTPGYAEFAGFDRPDNLEYFSAGSDEIVERAIFGEIGYQINDQWQVTIGGRYYDYEIELQTTVDFPLFDPGFVAANLDEVASRAFDPELRQADDGTLFKLNTSYEVSDDVTIYATVSEGFRIGGGNGGGPCDAFDPNAPQGACNLAPGQQFGPGANDFALFDERAYGPDTTRNYELGAKTQWADGRVTVNGALFFVDWQDPQVRSATVNANIPIRINANGAESTGIELSGDWRATDQLRFRSSFSYTKSELSARVPSLIRTITNPPGFTSAFEDGLDGDRLPGSPETQFSLFATYDIPLANGREISVNSSYSYQGDVVSRAGARGDSLTLDSFGMANASAVYSAEQYTVTLYVNNLFDEFAETGAQSSRLSNQNVLGANVRSFLSNVATPRTIGARFSYRF
jgi:outer membrane receptor protein involved in Fe transport